MTRQEREALVEVLQTLRDHAVTTHALRRGKTPVGAADIAAAEFEEKLAETAGRAAQVFGGK